jgi:hypothetical protein
MRIRVRTSLGSGATTLAGRLAQTLFFGIFLAMGCGFSLLVLSQARESLRSWTFREVPALVLTSQVEVHLPPEARAAMGELEAGGSGASSSLAEAEGMSGEEVATEDGDPYRLAVRYRYQVGDQSYTSERVGGGASGSSVGALERQAAAWRPGSTVTAYVDPADPTQAVLRRGALWSLLVLAFPGVFVLVGLGGIVAAWRRPRASSEQPGRRQSISGPSGSGGNAGAGCAAVTLGLLGVGALAVLVLFFGRAGWRSLASQGWTAVPCTVVTSWVGDHGDTYSVEVLYRYVVDGREHRGSRYHFFSGSSSGWDDKQAAVARLPPGSTQTCWVDPADPFSAVLERGVGSEMWFALIPALFAAVGFAGMFAVLSHSGRRRRSDPAEVLPALQGPIAAASERGDHGGADHALAGFPGRVTPSADALVLRPTTGPVGKVFGAILLAAVVNGIVGTFGWLAVFEPMRKGESIEGCVVLFLIPFALVAVGLLVNIPYQLLAAWNPRPQLVLEPGPLRVGRSSRLSWRFVGAASRLRSLSIVLEAAESASYRQGTRTQTARSTFYRETLFSTVHPSEIAHGEVTVTLPPRTMHSFAAGHNKVEWKLTLSGTIDNWPDVNETFELAVAPPLGSE